MTALLVSGFSEALSDHTLLEMVLASLVIFVATSVQVGVGIAFGLVAGPLLALIDLAYVPVPVLFLTLFTAVVAAWGERSGIHWNELRYSVSGRFFGSVVGLLVLSAIPGEKAFMLLFGSLIALAVLVSVSGIRIPFTLPSIGIAGFFSGITASITSVGGPPIAVVYQRQSSTDARPTLQTFFALGAFVTLIVLSVGGQVSFKDFALAVLLVPALALGFVAGPRLRPLFDRNFRRFLLGSAAVAAVLLIFRGLS